MRLEQREVHDPQEVQPALVDRRPTELEAEVAEHVAHAAALVGDEEQQVAGLALQRRDEAADLVLGQELGDR